MLLRARVSVSCTDPGLWRAARLTRQVCRPGAGPQLPRGMPRLAGMPGLPAPSGATYRSRTSLAGKRCRGRASQRQPTGRSTPGPVNRRLVQLTRESAARPGSPAAPRRAAPSRQYRPPLATARSTRPHTARGGGGRGHRQRRDARWPAATAPPGSPNGRQRPTPWCHARQPQSVLRRGRYFRSPSPPEKSSVLQRPDVLTD